MRFCNYFNFAKRITPINVSIFKPFVHFLSGHINTDGHKCIEEKHSLRSYDLKIIFSSKQTNNAVLLLFQFCYKKNQLIYPIDLSSDNIRFSSRNFSVLTGADAEHFLWIGWGEGPRTIVNTHKREHPPPPPLPPPPDPQLSALIRF